MTETDKIATGLPATQEDIQWTRVIQPRRGLFSVPLAEIWAYRDLLLLLVRRDFVALYKQTVLGPIWFIIQPLMMTIVFTIVFGNIANISTDGVQHTVFYLAGITMWTFFADAFTKTIHKCLVLVECHFIGELINNSTKKCAAFRWRKLRAMR